MSAKLMSTKITFPESPPKVMFDENMGKQASGLLSSLLALHRPPVTSAWLNTYLQREGALDSDWVTRLADEGGWVIVSCDAGRARGGRASLRGPPLHLIAPARGVTAFILAGKIANASGFEKARAVICIWSQLLEQSGTAEPGTRFRITRSGHGYRFAHWPPSDREQLPPSA